MATTKRKVTKKEPQKKQVQEIENPKNLHKLIEVEAYYIAEKRGFQGGDPVADWYMAEAKVNHGSSMHT